MRKAKPQATAFREYLFALAQKADLVSGQFEG